MRVFTPAISALVRTPAVRQGTADSTPCCIVVAVSGYPNPHPPVTLTHTLPLLYPSRCLTLTMCSTRETDCDAGVRELAAALGWQHELERLCSQAGAVHRAPPRSRD
eukprot:scaffold10807_cov79-Phaeocystis_antarctica.AAC.5